MHLKKHSRLPTRKCPSGTGGEVNTVIWNLIIKESVCCSLGEQFGSSGM